jgi:hypothetical protein
MPHINYRRIDGKGRNRWVNDNTNRKVSGASTRQVEPRKITIAKAIVESKGK